MEIKMEVLVDFKITPDEYVYLYYLVNKKLCPVTFTVDYTRLETRQLVKVLEGKIVARQKALDMFKQVPITIKKERSEEVKNAIIKSTKLVGTVEDWIQEWREIFPSSIKTGGYPVRGTKQGCINKMKAFIKQHKGVTKELIFKATNDYIEDRRQTRFQYMKMADYFISKDGGSLLETYIELHITGINPNNNGFDQATNNLADDI